MVTDLFDMLLYFKINLDRYYHLLLLNCKTFFLLLIIIIINK